MGPQTHTLTAGLSFGPCPFGVKYWLLAPTFVLLILPPTRALVIWPAETLFVSEAAEAGEDAAPVSTAAKARADADKSFNIGDLRWMSSSGRETNGSKARCDWQFRSLSCRR